MITSIAILLAFLAACAGLALGLAALYKLYGGKK